MTDEIKPKMSLDRVLWESFRHFVHLDEANAAIHTSPVRYSPLTFRVAELLHEADVYEWLDPNNATLLGNVIKHIGNYEEDLGR